RAAQLAGHRRLARPARGAPLPVLRVRARRLRTETRVLCTRSAPGAFQQCATRHAGRAPIAQEPHMNSKLRKILAISSASVALAAAAGSAHAGGVHWSVGVNVGVPVAAYPAYPVYQEPAAVYPAAPVVYQAPPPVVVAPPVVYGPPAVVYRAAPVYVAPGYWGPRGYWHGGHYYHGGHGHGEWRR